MGTKINTGGLPAYEVKPYIDELYYLYCVITGEREFKETEISQIPAVLEITKAFTPTEFEAVRPHDKWVTRISPAHLDDYINSGKKCLTTGFLKTMEQFRNFQQPAKADKSHL